MIGSCDVSVDDLPCGYFVTTTDRKVSFANTYLVDEFGWDADTLIGQSVEVLLSRGSHLFCDSFVFPMLLNEGECREIQLTCLTSTGERVPVVANMRRLSGGSVSWSFFCAENRNKLLEELANAREAAERSALDAREASAAKTLFLTTMSHELRTPLNGVIGMASALDQTPLSDAQREMLATVSSAGNHLLNLVDDVLDVAKIESGSVDIKPSPFHAGELVSEVCSMIRPNAEDKGLRLLMDVAISVDRSLCGDLKRIRQVVVNLVSNAVKFTDQGTITVRADLDGTYLSVSVTDTGPGVPDDQKHRIFERFSRGSHTVALERGGIGLGLAISKTICTLHGGDLIVSDAPGGGSVFAATFMVDVEQTTADASKTTPTVVADVQPLRLLFAEDNPMNQKVAEAIFSIFPVTTFFVGNGQDALNILERDDFDAALIDINMPDMSGIECVRALRKSELENGRKRLPTIAFTANVMAEQIAEYIDNGFDRHLAKPIAVETVGECIQWITDRRHSPTEAQSPTLNAGRG